MKNEENYGLTPFSGCGFVGNNPISVGDALGLGGAVGAPPNLPPKPAPALSPKPTCLPKGKGLKPGPLFYIWWGTFWYGVGANFSGNVADAFVPDSYCNPDPIPCPKKKHKPDPDKIKCTLTGSSLADPELDQECYYRCTGPNGYE